MTLKISNNSKTSLKKLNKEVIGNNVEYRQHKEFR